MLNYPNQGSKLMLAVVDSAGNTGGVSDALYDIAGELVSYSVWDTLPTPRSWQQYLMFITAFSASRRRSSQCIRQLTNVPAMGS